MFVYYFAFEWFHGDNPLGLGGFSVVEQVSGVTWHSYIK